MIAGRGVFFSIGDCWEIFVRLLQNELIHNLYPRVGVYMCEKLHAGGLHDC